MMNNFWKIDWNLRAKAFDPVLTSTLINDLDLQSENFRLSLLFFRSL